MICIHLGVVEAPADLGAVVIREPQDYIAARVAIRDALNTSEQLEVFVVTRVCDEWFWDMEKNLHVEFLDESPAKLLAKKLRAISLPPEIADPDFITAHALLSLPLPVDGPPDIIGWVLGSKLGDVWEIQEPSFSHLTSLVRWLVVNVVPEGFDGLAERRMQYWVKQARGQLSEAYRAIRADPKRASLFLSCWKALAAYDEAVLVHWLEEEGWYLDGLRWIAPSIGDLVLPGIADQRLSLKAEIYWRRRLKEMEESL